MKETDNRIVELIMKYLRQELTPDEQRKLNEWRNENEANQALFLEFTEENSLKSTVKGLMEIDDELGWYGLQMKMRTRKKQLVWTRIAVAASVLIVLTIGFYLLQPPSANPEQPMADGEKNNAIINTNRAQLLLPDGSSIALQAMADSSFIIGNTRIRIEGTVLQCASVNRQSDTGYCKLITNHRSSWQVIMPDSTRGFLNAGSSIRFPLAMAVSRRQVESTGEIFLDVKEKDGSPFILVASDLRHPKREAVIEVTGTQFNVNAYPEESSIKTSLVEGRLVVTSQGISQTINQGEAMKISDSGVATKAKFDMEETLAWKSNQFIFRQATINTIMNELKRWYNLDVEFQSKSDQHFHLIISRSVPVETILSQLEHTGLVQFEHTGNKVVVK